MQIERARRDDEASGKGRRRRACVKGVDVAPPLLERGLARLPWPAVVGDVVDGAAERIDFKHRLALWTRQNAHPGIERAAARARGRGL